MYPDILQHQLADHAEFVESSSNSQSDNTSFRAVAGC
jgi:hypothetical protein